MKIGIYIPGLGQSFAQESVVSYATRLKNEISFRKTGVDYQLKTEKITYAHLKESTVVTIIEKDGENELPIYRLYDFRYGDILTGKFNKYNLFVKNALLLGLVIKKFPGLFWRLIRPKGFDKPWVTFYLFLLFLIIAAAVLFTVPACISMATQFTAELTEKDKNAGEHLEAWFNSETLKYLGGLCVSLSALILLLIPKAKLIVTALATEFTCAHHYLAFGAQSQEILGNLDLLVEYIAEKEPGSKIHLHSYSFGSLVALDYLFTFGNRPSKNVEQLVESIITIGAPVEFVRAYYPNFYNERDRTMEAHITWLNVYSIADALSSNFRKDAKRGEAVHGLGDGALIPVNLNYEVAQVKKFSLSNFFSMYAIRVHAMYWDPNPEGQSCVRIIYDAFEQRGLLA